MESKDLGYTDIPSYQATSLSPSPPAYSLDFNHLYQQWILSVGASKELVKLETELLRSRKELESAATSLKKLKGER